LLNTRQGNNNRRRPRNTPNGRPHSNQGNGSRIDNRARGNAPQLLEKYKQMARDAQLSGDRVMTEYYLQFADHYFRVVSEQRSRYDDQPRNRPRQDWDDDESGDMGFEATIAQEEEAAAPPIKAEPIPAPAPAPAQESEEESFERRLRESKAREARLRERTERPARDPYEPRAPMDGKSYREAFPKRYRPQVDAEAQADATSQASATPVPEAHPLEMMLPPAISMDTPNERPQEDGTQAAPTRKLRPRKKVQTEEA
jgi:Domain of unknown function (DUF4167)